jgi:hypothetical protein
MSKIFDLDLRKGSFVEDINKFIYNPSFGLKFSKGNKGISISGNNSTPNYQNANSNISLSNMNKHFVMEFCYDGNSGINACPFIIGQEGAGNTYFFPFIVSANNIYIVLRYNGTYIVNTSFPVDFKEENHVIFTANCETQKWELFFNGEKIISQDFVNPITDFTEFQNNLPSYLHAQGNTSRPFRGRTYYIRFYNELLSHREKYKLYQEFLTSQPLEIQKKNFSYPKPPSLFKEGLIAAYNMIPSSEKKLIDISGNEKDGEIIDGIGTKDGMKFRDGSHVKLPPVILKSKKQVIFIRFKLNSLGSNQGILSCGSVFNTTSPYLLLTNNSTTNLSIYNETTKYFNITNTLTTNTVYDVILIDDPINLTQDIYFNGKFIASRAIGNVLGTNDFTFIGTGFLANNDNEILDFKVQDDVTEQEIKDYHNQYANQITFKDDFEYEYADDTNQVPKEWSKHSGNFEIIEENNEKSLQCVNDGSIGFQSKQAYGTWEFDTIKDSITAYSNHRFIASNIDDSLANVDFVYTLNLYNDKSIRLYLVENGVISNLIFSSGANYFDFDTNYRIKITRDIGGEFKVYIKGGSFGNKFTLVGTGVDNTQKECNNFFIFRFNGNDSLSNIVLKKGIEV